ncbi:MAG: hypothetical protein KA157_00445 [Aliarcobacter sp.]|nr:hypothetical protein [Aliarcobacter sp.]
MLKKFLILCIFSSMAFSNTQICFIADKYTDSEEWRSLVDRGNELSSWIENVTKNKISSCKVLTNSELEIASEIVEQSPTYAFVLK